MYSHSVNGWRHLRTQRSQHFAWVMQALADVSRHSTRGNDSTRLPSNVLSLPHRSVHVRRRTRQRRDRAAGLVATGAGGGQIIAQCATALANVMRFSLKSPCQIDCIINALDDVRRHGRNEYVVVHGVTPSCVLHPECDGARWLIRPLWLSAAAQDVDPNAAAASDRYVGDTPGTC